MTAAVAVLGWMAALLGVRGALVVRRRLEHRMELVARACHELASPLSCAQMGLESAARVGPLSTEQIRAMQLELRQAGVALEDLRTANGGAGHAPALEPVDLRAVLEALIDAWRPRAEAAHGRLSFRWVGLPVRVWGDRVRLAQATANLIANAIEHGRGDVEVVGSNASGWARLEVSDSGPGLPAPVAELARTPRGGRGARGRGLAIASAIAEAHGGRVAAAPAPRGARVVLWLPARG